MKQRTTTQRVIYMVVGVTTGILAFALVNEILYPKQTPPMPQQQEQLLAAEPAPTHADSLFYANMLLSAKIMNDKAPIKIDDDTYFDKEIVLSYKSLQYNYTMVKLDKDKMDIQKFEEKQKSEVLNVIKTSDDPGMVKMRKREITIVYLYNDKNGKLICSIVITPDMYK